MLMDSQGLPDPLPPNSQALVLRDRVSLENSQVLRGLLGVGAVRGEAAIGKNKKSQSRAIV